MIKDAILKIKADISLICSKINRKQNKITIVAVSKGRTLEEIKEVIAAGITDIGENKVQEAISKYRDLTPITYNLTPNIYNPTPIKWHLVGHLQTNKVKEAVKTFDLIHSVDSLKLAEEIEKQARKINKIQDILIEVKTSLEETKFGVESTQVIDLLKNILPLSNLRIQGLMTIAPLLSNPEEARPYFKTLRQLRDEINQQRFTNYDLRVLSMGMTQDYLVAIEEGANMLRIGRAIFEGTD